MAKFCHNWIVRTKCFSVGYTRYSKWIGILVCCTGYIAGWLCCHRLQKFDRINNSIHADNCIVRATVTYKRVYVGLLVQRVPAQTFENKAL